MTFAFRFVSDDLNDEAVFRVSLVDRIVPEGKGGIWGGSGS